MRRVGLLLISVFVVSLVGVNCGGRVPNGNVVVGDGDGDGDGDAFAPNGFDCPQSFDVEDLDLDANDGEVSCRLEADCSDGERLIVECNGEADDDAETAQYFCVCNIGGDARSFSDVGLCAASDEARDRRTREGCSGEY